MGNGPWLESSAFPAYTGVPTPLMSVQSKAGPPGSSLSIQL